MMWLLSYTLRPFRHGIYMRVLQQAYELLGIRFTGRAKYIHYDAFIDNIGSITLGKNIVISTKVIVLAHDYSCLLDTKKSSNDILSTVVIGDNCFIGAGAIILPGTIIGDNSIVGAGSVVKGIYPSSCVIAGNPAKVIKKLE